jgi:hypothetical protein
MLLVLAMIIPTVCLFSLDASADEKESSRLLEGKTYSILGDSISTYTDVSAGKAADTTNSTIRKSAVHYTPGKWDGVYLEDTWWVQLEEITGLRRLANNSWSGSAVFAERVGTVGGYIDRCVQLHDDTGENAGEVPDIIFVFLGTNDFSYYQDLLFSEGGINYDKLIVKTADGYTYAEPKSVVEAYAIMIHKITLRYPDSELYCFSMMTRRDTNKDKVPQPIEFNRELKAISDRFGAIWVDLFNIGIPSTDGIFEYYFPDKRVHPGVLGMDNVTSAVWTTMLHNSRFIPESTELCEVKKSGDFVRSYRDELLNHLLADNYSRYTGNMDALGEAARVYPNLTLSVLIPASDLEELAARCFGLQSISHTDGELFTYLEKIECYTFSMKAWEKIVRVVPERIEETYHTYRVEFYLEKAGERAGSYQAVFVKRSDGSAYLRALEKI